MRILLVLVMILALPLSALADGGPVRLEIEAGFEGRAKTGKWVPVTVTIHNDGAELEGLLQADSQVHTGENRHTGTYRIPVVVPAGAAKRVTLLLPVEAGVMPEVRLLVGGTAVAAVRPHLETSWDILVGVLGVEPADLPSVAGMRAGERTVRLVQLDAASFPAEPLVLENLDALLLDRFAVAELSQGQRQALQAWVESGGILIAAGGPEAGRLGGLAPWAPFRIAGVETVAVAGVGQAPLALLELDEAGGWRTLRREGVHPLTARLAKGAGTIHLLAFDPALEPFASWQGLPALFGAFFPASQDYGMGMGMGMGGMPGGKVQMMLLDSLNQMPMGEIPSARGLIYVLIIYGLVIGPAHFLLLRGFRRTAWGLLSLPVLTLAGAGGMWAYIDQARASDVMVSAVTIVEGQPGGGALRVHGLAGFYLPPGSTRTVALGDALLSPLAPPYMPIIGQTPRIEHQTMIDLGRSAVLAPREEWAVRPIAADALLPGVGTIRSQLAVDQFRIIGTITNDLPFTLKDLIVVAGSSFQMISRLEPGQTADVNVMLPAFGQQEWAGYNPVAEAMGRAYSFGMNGLEQPTKEHIERMRRQPVIWSAGHSLSFASGPSRPPVVLVGWTDYQPLPVKVNGREQATDGLTLYAQPLPISFGTGDFSVPSGFMEPRAVEWGGTEGFREPLHPGWSMPKGGNVTITFEIPDGLAERVTALEVRAPTLQGSGPSGRYPLAVELLRWSDGAWVGQPASDDGLVRPQDPAPFVGPEGRVQVRVIQVLDERVPLSIPSLTVSGKGERP